MEITIKKQIKEETNMGPKMSFKRNKEETKEIEIEQANEFELSFGAEDGNADDLEPNSSNFLFTDQ